MVDMYERQQRALAKAKQVLLDAEKARSQDRIGRLLEKLISGELELLKDREFTENLGPYVSQMYHDGRRPDVIALLARFDGYITDNDRQIRENSVSVLSKFSTSISDTNDLEILHAVFLQFVCWLEFETEYIRVFGVACNQAHKLTQRLLSDDKYWQETLKLTTVVDDIGSGRQEKSDDICGTITKLQESLATKDSLEKLVRRYLSDTVENSRIAASILTTLGHRSTIYLVNQLMHSKDKNVRLQLVKLIPGAGASVVPILRDCLDKSPPWFVIRNVIFILSELNDEAYYPIVEPYLCHRDIRVQQQALSCIIKISGDHLQERLIAALKSVHEELKIKIVMQLGQAGDDYTLVSAFVELLQLRWTFMEEWSTELVVKLCIALKSSPSKEAVEILQEIVEERTNDSDPTNPITVAARETLTIIEPKYRHDIQAFIEIGTDGTALRQSSVQRVEQSIESHIARGELEKAGDKLFSNGVNAARNKDFITAETLRDRLLELNPLALSEVIRLGEIIEEEKSSTVNNHHIVVWSGLYEKMSTEEFNALYYAMRQESYAADEVIVRAGDNDPSLYFVNSGTVTLSCRCGKKETFLKRLQPGEVIGVGPFFSVSVWTVSMTAQAASQIHVLSRQKYLELKKDHPGLEKKLENFCTICDTVPELLRMSGSDRRESARYSITVMVRNILLDPYGNAGKRAFRGELIDISRGGLCFSIKISSTNNARLLLGRQIVTEITLGDGNILKCFGIIVGVKFHEQETQSFSVHVKFYRNLDQVDFKQVINLEI
ncbi:MAG: cyclic nucleotide-binding domain-containing protein [Desulfocapsaceae bacterium]|jgi:CRP-like cAMP-binding protein|nr:cyclic nucleotide-binding domain-containing protein [Desulfocapsaceae bacterium]